MKKETIAILFAFAVLLAIIVFFVLENTKANEKIKEFDANTQLFAAYNQGYATGQADTIKIINTAIWKEVSTKGFLQLVDLDTNAQVILVPYKPQSQ